MITPVTELERKFKDNEQEEAEKKFRVIFLAKPEKGNMQFKKFFPF